MDSHKLSFDLSVSTVALATKHTYTSLKVNVIKKEKKGKKNQEKFVSRHGLIEDRASGPTVRRGHLQTTGKPHKKLPHELFDPGRLTFRITRPQTSVI